MHYHYPRLTAWLAAAVFASLSTQAQAALHAGTDTLSSSTFDFSSPAAVIDADLEYVAKSTGGSGEVLIGNNTLVATADTCLDSVRSAPISNYEFVVGLTDSNRTHVFCVKTTENRYAKFKIIGYARPKIIIIQWVYQDDGSRNFGLIGIARPATAITWGALKRYGGADVGSGRGY